MMVVLGVEEEVIYYGKLPDRDGDWCSDVGGVELDHLVASPFADVLCIRGYPEFVSCLEFACAELQIVIVEFRVAQPEAERKQWLAFEVTIGTTLPSVFSK